MYISNQYDISIECRQFFLSNVDCFVLDINKIVMKINNLIKKTEGIVLDNNNIENI